MGPVVRGESPKMPGMPSGISVLVNYLLRFPFPPPPSISHSELFVVNYKGLPFCSTLARTVGQACATCSMQHATNKLQISLKLAHYF